MFKEFSNNNKDDDYLSEFRQKIATQKREDIEERRHELQRSRNGFIGTIAGVILAGIVSWFLLIPKFSDSDSTETPIIRRPISPAKIQPNEPGGMEILNQDKSVYALVEKKETEPAKIESLLPPPEVPKMPTIVPEPEAVQAPSADIAPEQPTEAIATEDVSQTAPTDELLPIKTLDEKIEEITTSSGQKINIPEKLPEIAVEAKTVEVESAPTKAAEVKPSPAPVVTKETPKPVAITTGVWQVQLMASTNKSAVEKGWKNLSTKYGFLANQPYEVESSGGFFRLKAGAFANRSDADKLCADIKKAGGTCLVKKK